MGNYLIVGIPAAVIGLAVVYILLYNRLQRLHIKVEEAGADIDVALEKRFDMLSEQIEAVKKYLSHEHQIMTDVTKTRMREELEEKKMNRQQDAQEEMMAAIDKEIARQSRMMEQIKGNLDRSHIRRGGGKAGEGFGRRSNGNETLGSAEGRLNHTFSQKVGVLAGVHHDLADVGAGINALAEQYPVLNGWIPVEYFQRTIYDSEEHLQAARRLYNANVSLYNQMLATIPWSVVASMCRMEKADFYETEGHKRTFQVKFD